MSSHSSSASGPSSAIGGGEAGYDGQGSPVPYRIGPLAYEPLVLCKCPRPLKACRWISWSRNHPGQRYYRCVKARSGEDCGFFRWADPEFSEWGKELLRDLRDAVWNLKKEVAKKEAELEEKELQLMGQQREIEEKNKQLEEKHEELHAKERALKEKVEALQAKEGALEAKDAALQLMAAKMKSKNQSFDALIVLCVILLIFMVVVLLRKP